MSESTSTITSQTNNQLFVDFNREKVFIGENDFLNAVFTNDSGGDLTYPCGTLLGRLTAGGKVKPLASAAVDGSQTPVGILAQTITVLDTADANISMAISGEVDEGLVVLDGSDTLDTTIGGRAIRDLIAAETKGIFLRPTTELTLPDNS